MKTRCRPLLAGLTLAAALAACQPAPSVLPSPTQGAAVVLTPYRTATPSPTPAAGTATPTPLPTPTPTPFTYKVVKGDDMFGIALRFGVEPAALKTANPTVDPRFLSVGTILIVPLASPTPESGPQPTPTQSPVEPGPARCYPTAGSGLWCFAALANPHETAVEDLSARFTLIDAASGEQTAQTVSAPLNLLPAGAALPLAAFFPAPVPAEYSAVVQILTGLPISAVGERYLSAAVADGRVAIAADGASARVTGRVALPAGSGPAGQAWVLAAAYDAAGNPIGLRRWDAPDPSASGDLAFDVTVYSAGPPIARVETLVEARPPAP